MGTRDAEGNLTMVGVGRIRQLLPPASLKVMLFCLVISAQVQGADDDIPPSPAELPARTFSAATEKSFQNKPLSSINATIKATSGDLPQSHAAVRLSEAGVLFDAIDDSRPWMAATQCEWDAPSTRHLPLFFEEPNLERLCYTQRYLWDVKGIDTPPVVAEIIQPAISGVHFFTNLGLVPYKCGVDSPIEPIYTLGVDRPGSPIVYREYLIPFSLPGTIYQAGVVSGLVFGIR